MHERDAEITALRREIERLRRLVGSASPERVQESGASESSIDDDYLAGALNSSLLRQGVRVLPIRTVEFAPEITYLYDEPDAGSRRDRWNSGLSIRIGLPWTGQIELRLPYVLRDVWSGVGTSRGIGDVSIGLSKEVIPEKGSAPSLLVFGSWRSRTGDVNRIPSTGSGQDAVQLGVTATKREEPVVLYGSLSYTVGFGSAALASGARADAGDIIAGRFGAVLAATPDVALSYGISLASNAANRVAGVSLDATDRLFGTAELGASWVLARGLYLTSTAAVGFTPGAPKLSINVAVPYRF